MLEKGSFVLGEDWKWRVWSGRRGTSVREQRPAPLAEAIFRAKEEWVVTGVVWHSKFTNVRSMRSVYYERCSHNRP